MGYEEGIANRKLDLGSEDVELHRDDFNNEHFPVLHLSVKVFLQGPYAGKERMNKSLNTAGILTSHFGANTFPSNAVDSISIEIRNAAVLSEATIRRFTPAWLLADGSICKFSDTARTMVDWDSLSFGQYYIVVRHRNHLAIMSRTPVSLSGMSTLYDFTTGLEKYYGGDAKDCGEGVYGLWSGDVTGNGQLKYSGSGNDRSPILTRIGGTDLTATLSGYYNEDVNINGQVKYSGSGNDRSFILNNLGGADLTATKSTKVPN